ncbi:MAG: TIM barrel protein [bacterium]|nr:TIM barrel protein [bacterium]
MPYCYKGVFVIKCIELKKSNMLLLCTDSLKGYGLNRIFDLTKQAGYDGIDLAIDYNLYDTYNIKYIKTLIEQYQLPVHAVSAPDEIQPKRFKHIVELSKEIGAKVIILQPPKITEFKLQSYLKKEIPKIREKEFISIALENAPKGTFLGILREHAMSNTQDLKDFKHISLDTARIGEMQKDLIRAYAAFKKFLVHVHLSNVYHGKKYSPPTEGVLPLESLLTKLRQDKYPGAIALKILPRHLKVGDDETVLEELGRAKKFFDKYYTNVDVSGESSSDATPTASTEAPAEAPTEQPPA